MGAAILFRFYTDIKLCRERLKLIRHLNPTLPLFGLYGGPREELVHTQKTLATVLDDIWLIPTADAKWKWLHEDLSVREWFRQHGCKLDFDCIYDHEYDLLLMRPWDLLVPEVKGRAVALSGLKRLGDVRERWYWTSVEPFAGQFEKYVRFMRRRYGLELQTNVSQGPFPVLSRQFLEAMCTAVYPDEVFRQIVCEISYPGMAEALGFAVVDTGLHPGWTAAIPSIPASKLFHCGKTPLVELEQIAEELNKPDGRRAFHPVKEFIDHHTMVSLLDCGKPPHP
jgi:hypothetical protein